MPKPQHDAQAATVTTKITPLPNQRPLPFDDDEAPRQSRLFDSGDDLPGAAEKDQQILWDVAKA
jgi:hypothetical protein